MPSGKFIIGVVIGTIVGTVLFNMFPVLRTLGQR